MSSPVVAPSANAGNGAQGALAAGIASIASALPDGVVTSEEIGARLGVEPGWIASRTGINERRHAAPDETLAGLASTAAERALDAAGVEPADLDLVLVATSTADERVPTAAPLVAGLIGAERAGTIDIGAACTGFVSALDLAAGSVESGRAGHVLVIGAELMSTVLDLDDARTAGLFGDGAGAAVVTAGGRGAIGPIVLRADAGNSRLITASHEENLVRMDGRATFRNAVARLSQVTLEVVEESGKTLDEIDLFVYHQANGRILSAVGDRLGLEPSKVVDSIARHGNTSAASIPLALDDAQRDGRLRDGSRVLLGAFGAGLTWGAGIVEWGTGGNA
jgi:3-oxoacyl-[acyl-carrier-protein] synthase-3